MASRHRVQFLLLTLALLAGAALLVAWQPWFGVTPPGPAPGSLATAAALDPEALLRLHVIAHSDDAGDQRIKLLVRDAVVQALARIPALRASRSAVEAAAVLADHRRMLREAAREVLRQFRSPYDVRVQIGRYPYPGRAYAGVWIPPGMYPSLRVVLGEGRGANWWCVLFPPVCTVPPAYAPLAAEAAGVPAARASTPASSWLATGDGRPPGLLPDPPGQAVQVRLAFWDWLRRSLPQAWAAAGSP